MRNSDDWNPRDVEQKQIAPELNNLCYQIIGAAIEVHRELGPGFLEVAYEEALAAELTVRQIPFERQILVPDYYKERPVADQRLDLLVDGAVLVELKAVESLSAVHVAQVLSYLKAGPFHVGLLINFNVPVLKTGIRRLLWNL